jgi:hypothetical protein
MKIKQVKITSLFVIIFLILLSGCKIQDSKQRKLESAKIEVQLKKDFVDSAINKNELERTVYMLKKKTKSAFEVKEISRIPQTANEIEPFWPNDTIRVLYNIYRNKNGKIVLINEFSDADEIMLAFYSNYFDSNGNIYFYEDHHQNKAYSKSIKYYVKDGKIFLVEFIENEYKEILPLEKLSKGHKNLFGKKTVAEFLKWERLPINP